VIGQIHARSRRTYGAPRVHAELARVGWHCGRKRVARLMRSQQLVGVHARRRWRRGRPDATSAPDLVERNFNPTGPDRLWAADVTQFRTSEGWLHLAAVVDLWSRRVIGWAMGNTVNAELVADALVMAFDRRRPDQRGSTR
jgi:putative transposase